MCQYQTVSGQVSVLSVSVRQSLVRYVYCLSVSDKDVYCLSVSDSFWTGMFNVCQYQTVSGQVCVSARQVCVFSVSIRQVFLIVCQYQTVS